MNHDVFNIEIKNLSIGYKQTGKPPVALREGIYFTARKGEMIALIGSNGIGKVRCSVHLSDFRNSSKAIF
jgi:ABC-type cobalamin/Fe3+-siderophores transport system ATPase subunit